MNAGAGMLRAMALLAAVLAMLLPAAAHAGGKQKHRVMAPKEAQALMFPGATAFVAVPAAEVARRVTGVAKDPSVSMRAADIRVWRVLAGQETAGYFVLDTVIGKFEKMEYAVALDAGGTVTRVEVLRYRESHGYEVMQRDWLAQFEGKSRASALHPGEDIDGITGATLSVNHLSDGVKRVARVVGSGFDGSGMP